MNCRKSSKRRQVSRSRGWLMSCAPPTAERIKQRNAEQERRRLQALANQIDLTMQNDVMTEFEKFLKDSEKDDEETP